MGHPQHEGDISPKFNIIHPAVSLQQSKQRRITRPVGLHEVLKTHERARAHARTHTHAVSSSTKFMMPNWLPKFSVYN